MKGNPEKATSAKAATCVINLPVHSIALLPKLVDLRNLIRSWLKICHR
jgi:hypothetical protein